MIDDPNVPAWFVWTAWHDKYHASIIYYALPESYEGKRGWMTSPIILTEKDKQLSLEELMVKYPPLKKEGK